ncbi:MAG: xanthine dehydrogenase family protein molybdopterin-binding subunit [Pseudomonadota bacterium]
MLPKLAHTATAKLGGLAEPSRRGFLIGALAVGGGFAVGFRPGGISMANAQAAASGPFNAYLQIAPDNTITVLSAHFEMGQGSYHGIATLVIEELGASWDDVTVVGASGNTELYGNLAWGGVTQGTGGSTAMASSWERYRLAGAAARTMLISAAAEAWGVPADTIRAEASALSDDAGNRATFGEMAERAALQPIPSEPVLKAPGEWTEIGNTETRRYDRVGKANGTQDFTIDIQLPDMLYAVPVHPPKFGATVASFDPADALAVRDVVDVVETPLGLAVVAANTWAAMQGRNALSVTWDETAAEQRGSDEILEAYRTRADEAPMAMARNDGDVEAAFASADRIIEATYEFPYLAHAALEPMNAVVVRGDDGVIEVWGGHQIPDHYQMMAAETAGVTPDQVRMRVMKTGGSFGRRAVGDADVIVETVAIARALEWRAPVKMQWTREDDMRAGRYRPAYVHKLRAALDADGTVIGWDNHIVGQSILAGTPFSGFIQNGIDLSSVEGANTLPYEIPNLSVGLTTTEVNVPVLWWRAVGSTHTAFATEAFFDEVARATGKDPVQMRLDLLSADHPRHTAVLQAVADLAEQGGAMPDGRTRGVALHESFNSVVAQIAEVSVDGADVTVHKVWCAVDCGTAINPDTIKAQMEGSVGFGLGSILAEEITITAGVVDQGNYDTYRPLRIDAMPDVEVAIVPSDNPPTGVGEPAVPPIGPAVANAILSATGRPVRQLPLSKGLSV